jgi:hypothetical protein
VLDAILSLEPLIEGATVREPTPMMVTVNGRVDPLG